MKDFTGGGKERPLEREKRGQISRTMVLPWKYENRTLWKGERTMNPPGGIFNEDVKGEKPGINKIKRRAMGAWLWGNETLLLRGRLRAYKRSWGYLR